MKTHRQIGESRYVKVSRAQGRGLLLVAVIVGLSAWPSVSNGQTRTAGPGTNEVWIEQIEEGGIVEVRPAGATTWVSTVINQGLHSYDRVRTGPNTRATLRWSDKSVVPMAPLTELEILPPSEPKSLFGLNLIKGIISFFHRDEPGRIRIFTRGAAAGIEGTEFVLEVDTSGPVERTILSVIDGRVHFYNAQGSQSLTNNQESIAEVGRPPSPPVGFIANNRLQWCFYYPGVLDLRDLPLTPGDEAALAPSLRAYRLGDLLAALRLYPAGRPPGSDAEQLYHAALVLSVGQVAQTEAALAALPAGPPSGRIQRLAMALRQLIAAVKRQPNPATVAPELSTELMAASYYEQSLAVREKSLERALVLARQAATNSPNFGFAWERVAELEFSFGRTSRAEEAFEKSYALSPRNAQALALEGFLLAAQNKTRLAIDWFNYAIAADSSLGNAWLGRGLCRIRRGDALGGREDLLVATALEPQRALLRSYLGKAYDEADDFQRAKKELSRAKYLDPKDPTAWLYSALLNQRYNRINEAVRDLETSQELNENRGVYRSGLMLDEDRAVRSANLAAIYRDAGMVDLSLREASKAVSYDYANYSAHLFLANSYDQLRDPNRVNLRYETPSRAEYLVANLLSPADAGTLSETISQQEYSRLFERDKLGVTSATEYLSRGAWTESGAQYGIYGSTAYSLEAFYHSDPGQHPNGDIQERALSAELKQQFTPQDTAFLQATYYEATGGDRAEYYDPAQSFPLGPNRGLRTQENQDPILSLGYHHEWGPGMHTLILGSRLSDRFSLSSPFQTALLVDRIPDGLDYVEPFVISQRYRSELEIASVEVQQIWQQDKHLTILGGRYQGGDFTTQNLQWNPQGTDNAAYITPDSTTPAQQASYSVGFERLSVYGYHHWQVATPLLLVAGIGYDRVTFPNNFRVAPIAPNQQIDSQISPKLGLILTPWTNATIRGAYTRSLSGASIDQSSTLEPSQVAGFLQSYRSIIPESIGGSQAGARFETCNAAFEQRFAGGTYISLMAELLRSKAERMVGEFEFNLSGYANVGSTPENLSYQEKSLVFTFDQLLGERFSLDASYRLSRADLWDRYSEVLPLVDAQDPLTLKGFRRNQHLDATLHQLNLALIYNDPIGLVGRLEASWYAQTSDGYAMSEPGDHFWQVNAIIGYRFLRRRAEVSVGLLNLADNNYHLNPLTLYNEIPRQRTFVARLLLNF